MRSCSAGGTIFTSSVVTCHSGRAYIGASGTLFRARPCFIVGVGVFVWADISWRRRGPESREHLDCWLKVPLWSACFCGRSSLGWHGVHFGLAAMPCSLGELMLFFSPASLRSTRSLC